MTESDKAEQLELLDVVKQWCGLETSGNGIRGQLLDELDAFSKAIKKFSFGRMTGGYNGLYGNKACMDELFGADSSAYINGIRTFDNAMSSIFNGKEAPKHGEHTKDSIYTVSSGLVFEGQARFAKIFVKSIRLKYEAISTLFAKAYEAPLSQTNTLLSKLESEVKELNLFVVNTEKEPPYIGSKKVLEALQVDIDYLKRIFWGQRQAKELYVNYANKAFNKGFELVLCYPAVEPPEYLVSLITSGEDELYELFDREYHRANKKNSQIGNS